MIDVARPFTKGTAIVKSRQAALTRMRWLVVASLLLVPFANAGDASDPEISDAGDDAGSRPGMDVQAFWVEYLPDEEAGPSLRFTFQMSGDPVHTPAFFALHEEFRYNFLTESMPGGAGEVYVSMRPTCSQVATVTNVPTCQEDIVSCRIGFAAERGTYQALEMETTVVGFMDAGDQMGCQATLAELQLDAGASLLDGYISHRVVVRGPLSSGDQVGPRVVDEFDRAPDEGFGRNFQMPAPAPEAPEPMNGTGNVTGNMTGNVTGDNNMTENGTVDPPMHDEHGNETTEPDNGTAAPDVEESPLGPAALPALLGAIAWRRFRR